MLIRSINERIIYPLLFLCLFYFCIQGFNLLPKKSKPLQVHAAKEKIKKDKIEINTDHFFVPLINFRFKFKPSGHDEDVEFYSHKDNWNYVLLNPYTNTLKWQLWGKLKSVEYFDNNCQNYSANSSSYQQKRCQNFVFSHKIEAQNSIRITYITKATRNGKNIKERRIQEALTTGKITF